MGRGGRSQGASLLIIGYIIQTSADLTSVSVALGVDIAEGVVAGAVAKIARVRNREISSYLKRLR